jgi:hypothetical protein
MRARLGAKIVDVLEQAGERYLKRTAPDAYAAFLLQVGGADTLREYEPSATYWERVQAILDHFFASPERAEIMARLIAEGGLRGRPEFRGFLHQARAERRVQEVIALAMSAGGVRWSAHVLEARRGE